jgi:dipeptidyl aminopeptidase/acylaminoacyl peptidase
MWAATDGAAFGADHQTATLRALLEAGFVVVTPEARLGGSSFWDTNVPPWAHDWAAAPDHVMMKALFAALEAGDLGPVNLSRLYAAGISSGGYMTSRMAVAYPSRFRALAVHSASFATCAGALCVLPSALPADHPPTLFLHGVADPVVPFGTMRLYRDALKDQGTEVAEVLEPQAGHAWLAAAPEAVRDFFLSH